MVMSSRVPQKKEYLKLFIFAVNPDNVWGFKLLTSKGLSPVEMGALGKYVRFCTINQVSSAFFWQQG